MRQKVFPHPTVGAPSASNSPSAISAQAQRVDNAKDKIRKYDNMYNIMQKTKYANPPKRIT